MQRNLRILYALPILLLFTACLKDYESVEIEAWNPSIAIPVLNTTLKIENLLDNFETGGYVNVDEDKFITLVYQGEVLSYRGEDIIQIPDINLPIIDTAMSIPYGNLAFNYALDEFKIKAGNFSYRFDSPYAQDLMVKIVIPNLKKNGKIFETDVAVSSTGDLPVQEAASLDLTGYVFDFYSQVLDLKYIAINTNTNERVVLDNVQFSFKDLAYSHVIGTFSPQVLDLPKDEIKIDLFTNSAGGSIYFEEPKIKIIFENSFGIPVELTAESLEVMTENGGVMHLNSVLDNGLSFNYPSLNELGNYKTTTLLLDKNNANIADVIANNPQEFSYDFSAILNPNNSNPVRGFIQDTSDIRVNVDVELPLWVRANGSFITEKSVDFDASIFENIKEAEFKLIARNGLPVDAGIQLYFEDDNGVIQDSLLQDFQNFLLAARIDSEGKVISNTENKVLINLAEDRIINFQKATKIRLRANITTENIEGSAVKFYSDYGLTLQLGLKATAKDL